MTVFDVILIILGLILIFVSFFLTEKASIKGSKGNQEYAMLSIDEEKLLAIQTTLEKNLQSLSEATVIKTENMLNKVTNEKIMAISDYSEQILEKIDQNHTEVVFLYNMLNEKESSVKQIMATRNSNPSESSSSDTFEDQVPEIRVKPKSKRSKTSNSDSSSTVIDNEAHDDEDEIEKVINRDEIVTPSNDTEKQNISTDSKENSNKQIMKLYSEGKSITEIAKLLELGKGEIKFVINLYQQKNNG